MKRFANSGQSRHKPAREAIPRAGARAGRAPRTGDLSSSAHPKLAEGPLQISAFQGQGFVTVVVCCLSTIPLPVSVVVVVDDVDSDGTATLGAVRLVDSLV
jgi:hypothetical protein